MKRLFLMLSAMLLAISVNANAGFEDVTMDTQLALVHFNTDSSMLIFVHLSKSTHVELLLLPVDILQTAFLLSVQ